MDTKDKIKIIFDTYKYNDNNIINPKYIEKIYNDIISYFLGTHINKILPLSSSLTINKKLTKKDVMLLKSIVAASLYNQNVDLILSEYKHLFKKISKNIDKENDIIISLGASFEKIANIFELEGYNVKYIKFSRTSTIMKKIDIDFEEHDEPKLFNLINKNLKSLKIESFCKGYNFNDLRKEKKRFIILDFMSSGRSLFVFSKLFSQCVSKNILAYTVSSFKQTYKTLMLKLFKTFDLNAKIEIYKPKTKKELKIFQIDNILFGISKMTRCIPRDEDRKLNKDEIIKCNLFRLLLTNYIMS